MPVVEVDGEKKIDLEGDGGLVTVAEFFASGFSWAEMERDELEAVAEWLLLRAEAAEMALSLEQKKSPTSS